MPSLRMVLAGLFFAFFILAAHTEVHAQVKLSDRKSEAYRQSRKNNKNKGKKREKRYRKAQKRDLEAGDIELVPEMLKEKYLPKNQNIEKNPGRLNFLTRRKQHRIFVRKARQALDQGLFSTRVLKSRTRNYRKQQRMIAQHQGNIRVRPYQLEDNRGMFPQPPVDHNPSRSNFRERNRKLANYARKSEEMSSQGLVSGPSQWRVKRQQIHQARKTGLFSGNLHVNHQQREATYMAKSVEGLSQGMRKSLTQKEQLQLAMSNSMAQSGFQGHRKARTKKQKEIGYIEKSAQAQVQGLYRMNSYRQQEHQIRRNSKRVAFDQGNLPAKAGNKDATYLAKSVEGLNQGLYKGVTRKEIQQQRLSNSLVQTNFQGTIKARSRDDKDAGYVAKSAELLDQGTIKGKSARDRRQEMMSNSITQSNFQGTYNGKTRKDHEQEMMSNSLAQSRFLGAIPQVNKRTRESYLIGKSKEALDQGLISRKTTRQKEADYMAKSVEGLNQGLIVRKNRRSGESLYIRKSQQLLDQGLLKGKSNKEKNQEMQSNSLVQALYQGNISHRTIHDVESQYIRKSKQALDQGLISSKISRRKEAEYMGKSVEILSQGLYRGKSRKQRESQFIRKSIEAQNTGLFVRTSRNERESRYIRKSIEALNQGLVSRLTDRQKEAIYMGKSVELLNQGMYRGRTIRDKESMYIRKSIEAQSSGFIKGVSKNRQDARIRRANEDIITYQGNVKQISQKRKDADIRDATREYQTFAGNERIKSGFFQDWFYRRSQAKNLHLTGDFKVRTRLFDDIYNWRMSMKQKKFDGMDRESKLEQWWASIWKKPVDQKKSPEPLRKPRYDPKEHEIWYY